MNLARKAEFADVPPRLLLVDDDPDLLRLLSMRLQASGYRVSAVDSAEAALSMLAATTPDLVISDVRLPGRDGLALFDEIRATHPGLPVILLTAHGSIPDAVDATARGVFDYLTKPFDSRVLLEKVSCALEVSSPASAPAGRDTGAWRDEIISRSARMAEVLDEARLVAASDASVLIRGASGTGKELLARAIHRASARADKPFVAINCGAIPEQLLESELFGHVKGAFTGASFEKVGEFQKASGGTLFLDEVGDMPLAMQAKLLRVLQEREIERVGGSETLKVDARVVAATNRDLVKACETDAFRADLYDRLNVVPLAIPPLRARRDDIPLLARHFLSLASKANDRPGIRFEDDAVAALAAYSFPGNVRELRNLVERLVILTPDDVVRADDVEQCLPGGVGPKATGLFRPGVPFRVLVEEAERQILHDALTHHGGQMAATARGLDLERSHLYKKAKALGLRGKEDDKDEG